MLTTWRVSEQALRLHRTALCQTASNLFTLLQPCQLWLQSLLATLIEGSHRELSPTVLTLSVRCVHCQIKGVLSLSPVFHSSASQGSSSSSFAVALSSGSHFNILLANLRNSAFSSPSRLSIVSARPCCPEDLEFKGLILPINVSLYFCETGTLTVW